MDENTVHISFFGALRLQNKWGNVEENRLRHTQPWLLLKYLLVNRGREVSHDELQKVLWKTNEPEAPEASRVRLRRVREALAPIHLDGRTGLVIFSSGRYRINPQYDIKTDDDELLKLLDNIDKCTENDPKGLSLCIAAINLFDGPFLQYTEDSPWLEQYRESYRAVFSHIGETMLKRMEVLDDDDSLSLLCRKAAAIVPGDEKLHRELFERLIDKKRQVDFIRLVTSLSHCDDAQWIKDMEI